MKSPPRGRFDMRMLWPGLSLTPKAASVCGALFVGVVGITAWSRPATAVPVSPASAVHSPAARAPAAPASDATMNPVLTHVPPQAALAPNAPTVVSLGVDRIADGATVRLEGQNFVYTFGRDSLVASHARVVDVAMTGVEPGTYLVSIVNPDGRRSAALPIVLTAR